MDNGGKKDVELETFLRNVNEVDSIIKGLASNDSLATEKADEFLQRYQRNTQIADSGTSVDRTVVNQEAFNNWSVSNAPQSPAGEAAMDAESFMAAMEVDCRERAERRRLSETVAERLRLDGNAAFNAGEYVEAAALYTEALSHVRHWTTLYTNRAQVYLRLDKFEEALEDCQWALRVDEKCLKAAVLQGKAYVGLRRYDEAVESYNKAREMDPGRQALTDEYIERARIKQAAERDEMTAGQSLEATAETGLVSLINRLCTPGQPVVYYTGALQLVRLKLTERFARTLFRSSGGFELSSTHSELSRCFNSSPRSLSAADMTLTALYVSVMRDACVDNDENQCHVLAMPRLPHQLMTFIESVSEMSDCRDLAGTSVDLLVYLSQTARNRSQIVLRYDAVRLISAAFMLARRMPGSQLALNSQRLICNLATSDQLRRQLRGDDFVQCVLASFNSLMSSDSLAETVGASLSVKTMVNLCGDASLRRAMSASEVTWSASVSALARLVVQSHSSHQLTSALLSLLANMAIDGTSSASQSDLVKVSVLCTDLVTQLSASESAELVDRCYLLLSRVLKLNADCVHAIVNRGVMNAASRDLARLVHEGEGEGVGEGEGEGEGEGGLMKHCVAAVTACTVHGAVSRRELIDSRPPLIGLLVQVLLSHESYDELVLGNTALCLSSCLSEPSAVHQLTSAARDRDVIMTLLVLARDQAKPSVQHNCAVLIARLVRAHAPYLDRLRELHGLEILHTVLRHVNR